MIIEEDWAAICDFGRTTTATHLGDIKRFGALKKSYTGFTILSAMCRQASQRH